MAAFQGNCEGNEERKREGKVEAGKRERDSEPKKESERENLQFSSGSSHSSSACEQFSPGNDSFYFCRVVCLTAAHRNCGWPSGPASRNFPDCESYHNNGWGRPAPMATRECELWFPPPALWLVCCTSDISTPTLLGKNKSELLALWVFGQPECNCSSVDDDFVCRNRSLCQEQKRHL